jgi:hypothetical protein
MTKRNVKLDPRIEALLKGVTYTVEHGAKHKQLRIGGRLVAVLPEDYNAGGSRQSLNALASVRRFLKQLKGGEDVRT